MSNIINFDVELFEQRLLNLKDTQEGIQQMSSWCLQQRIHHKKIVSSWLNVLKQVRVEHRLTLFYLANDVIQYSKRKNYEFVESWGTTLQKATTMVRDEKVREKIFRIFKIWKQREIYSEEYLADLKDLLSLNPVKKQQTQHAESSDEYQNSALIHNINECVRLASCTDKTFKNLPKTPICDTETIKNNLKDRSHSEDVEAELEHYAATLESFIKALKTEIKSRKSLINNVDQANKFYTNLKGEVKVVVNAYKNFGHRIKTVKRKLDEITPKLPSPMPSPDINAPSPEQDADIVLPDENQFAMSIMRSQSNGYTSYMDGNLPFDINDFKRESPKKPYNPTLHTATQPIQVISHRGEEKDNDFHHNDFFKPVTSNSSYTPSSVPLPVPPVTNYPMSQTQNPSYGNESVNYGSDAYDPITAVYTSDSNYNSSNDNYDNMSNISTNMSNMPLMPPPPMPALLGGQGDDFNSTWDMDMTWTSIESTSFNHSIETPVSPARYDRESINNNILKYADNVNDITASLQDVDHRHLHIPAPLNIKSSVGKDKSRCVDVDHRNLISLTGSPGAPKTSEIRKSSDSRKYSWSSDKDFRNSAYSTPSKVNKVQATDDYRKTNDTDYRNKNLQEIPKEKPSPPTVTSKSTTNKHSGNAIISNSDSTARPVSATSTPTKTPLLQPPPFPPNLDSPGFKKLKEFLTPPPNITDASMPPPLNHPTNSDQNNQSKSKSGSSHKSSGKSNFGSEKKIDPCDNVESIDMEMSDDDLDDFIDFEKEEITIGSEVELHDAEVAESKTDDEGQEDAESEVFDALVATTSNDSTAPSTEFLAPIHQEFKTPLLDTPPEFDNDFNQHSQRQHWNNFKQIIQPNLGAFSNNGNSNMPPAWNAPENMSPNANIPNHWKSPRLPMPGPQMSGPPGIAGNHSFPRGSLYPPQRNFNPQMRPNFRGSQIRPRGGAPPYFNNRRRGGIIRGGPPMGPRGKFRGAHWQ